jgi:gliding motility-associated-like protein
VTIDQAVNAGIDSAITICLGESVNLWTTLAGTPDAGGVWTDVLNGGGLTDSIFNSTGLSAGTYLFNYTLSGNDYCPDSEASIIVTVEGVPFAGIGDSLEVCGTIADLYAGLQGAFDNGGTWNDDDVSGFMLGTNLFDGENADPNETYHFTYSVTTTNCGSDTTTITVTTCDNSGTLAVPQGFSPNNDGVNDWFVVDGIEKFPQNTFTVFNRYGNKVFEAAPYSNGWDGRWDNENSAGDGLPIGTYFYILDLGNDTEPITGYIYLNR